MFGTQLRPPGTTQYSDPRGLVVYIKKGREKGVVRFLDVRLNPVGSVYYSAPEGLPFAGSGGTVPAGRKGAADIHGPKAGVVVHPTGEPLGPWASDGPLGWPPNT